MARIYDRTGDAIRSIYDRRIAGPPVLDLATYFPEGTRFAESWRAIRDEAAAVAESLASVPRFHEIMREQRAISANDGRDWRLFVLKAYGITHARNMARCPALAELVQAMPDVLSASISFMAPRKHIPRHRGPFRGVLRYYLMLSMPRLADGSPGAVLNVADDEYRLGDGDWLLWDDTYPHEVRNNTDAVRVALLLDVWRRGMPIDMEIFSRLLMHVVRAGILIRGLP
jgi:aspartate beta-hydroxylase